MPHVRERQPNPDELPEPGSPKGGPADLEREPMRAPGRVNADEAVTGGRAGSSGEAPPGGIPGDDGSLEGGDLA